MVWDGEQIQDSAEQNGYLAQQYLKNWYLQDGHGLTKDLGKKTHGGVSLPSFHYWYSGVITQEVQREYREDLLGWQVK